MTKKVTSKKPSFRFILPPELLATINRAQTELQECCSELEDFITNANVAFERKSSSWRESDRGRAVERWLDDLSTILDEAKQLDGTLFHDVPEMPS